MGPILWTKHFLAEQGYDYKHLLHQDNRSAMLLESNGRKSADKRSCHINIRYFFISDMKEKGRFPIRYCPTDKLVADYMTNGSKFKEFRQQIMNLSKSTIGSVTNVKLNTKMCVFCLWGFSGFYTCYVKKDSRMGYQTIKKKVPVATMNSTTRQECVGEVDN